MAFLSNLGSSFSNLFNGGYRSGGDYSLPRMHNFVNDTMVANNIKKEYISQAASGKFIGMNTDKNGYNILLSTSLQDSSNKNLTGIDYSDLGDVPTSFLNALNVYKKDENYAFNTMEFYMEGSTTYQVYASTPVVPSLFNPYYGVRSRGMHTNQPLLDVPIGVRQSKIDTSDCSIFALLRASGSDSNGVYDVGHATYKLADFMYCKDLGKVPNNHLITLRRFSMPVGDNIYTVSAGGNSEKDNLFSGLPDVGRLVTWFGTDDNKLSNILKMSFHATWKELNAEIQQVNSQADSADTGIFGMIANTLNPTYNLAEEVGTTGNHNLIADWMNSSFLSGKVNFGAPGQYEHAEALMNHDKNRVYEPWNTIQSNHVYEGKLLFENEFTLNFSYKIRAYGDLNQKSVMQDLIHNILAVTYRSGKFWGGSVKMIGAPGNNSMIKKLDAFVDDSFDTLFGFTESLLSGAVNWQELLGSLSQAASNVINNGKEGAKEVLNGGAKSAAAKVGEASEKFFSEKKLGNAIKGQLKNALGRPALYAINSLVPGENLGLWHVTIGNPFNPIVSMGNLIITNTELSFSDAPLGLDDFPTELKVAVTLKHCKPRDKTEIGKMFTKGESALALSLTQRGFKDFYDTDKQRNYFSSRAASMTKDDYVDNSMNVFGTEHIENIVYNWIQTP